MVALNLFIPTVVVIPTTTTRGRVRTAAMAAKSSGGGSEEKSLLDFVLGALQKEDQLLEVDPILQKMEGKTTGGTVGRKNSVVVPPKKESNGFGGFGGFFEKKE